MPGLDALLGVLEEARGWGFLGPGPVDAHVAHAQGFAAAVPVAPDAAVDLGTGGGVPGLVLALGWPGSRWVLVESQQRRAAFLTEAVGRLDLGDRVAVFHGRAEELGRMPEHRSQAALVTARSFGPPAVTAECAAPLLRVGGILVVSEPPHEGPRWDHAGLARLGLGSLAFVEAGARFAVLTLTAACPETYPRRVGLPSKRPLF